MTWSPSRAQSPNSITLIVRISAYELEGDANIWPMTSSIMATSWRKSIHRVSEWDPGFRADVIWGSKSPIYPHVKTSFIYNTRKSYHYAVCLKLSSLLFSCKSCSLFCNPMDCNLPGSSAHEIFQARTLEWENKMAEEEVHLSPRIYQEYTFRHRSAC